MIQRIQTIYLFVSLVLIALIFVVPIAHLIYGGEQFITFRPAGFYDDYAGTVNLPTITVVILISVILCVYIISIFLYKRRVIQARLCVINIVLLAGLLAVFIYHLVFFIKRVPGADFSPGLSILFPLIAVILTYLAFRSIRKDELLVKLAERIR
jgi:hypothetical protein